MQSNLLNSIGIDPGVLVISMMGILVFVLLYMVRVSIKMTRFMKRYRIFMKGRDAISLEKAFVARFQEMEKIEALTRTNTDESRRIRDVQNRTANKIGIVKYDAFDEMGGKLSFVLVMLDGRDNGILLNVMHSRDDCYTYIKEIKRGSSYVELSAEEQIALEKAMHQDRYFEDDRDGIPTGHTGNLKRAYTVAVRKEEAKKKARKMREKEAAEAKEIEAKAEEIMSKEDK